MAEHDKPAVVQPMDDSLYQRLARVLPKSQYRPYKLWMFHDTNTDQPRELRILKIKLNDQEAYSVCPELHLVAHGSDYLETQQAMHSAVLEKLGLPSSTQVAQTDIGKFDLNGNFLKVQASRHNDAPATAEDSETPAQPESSPEPSSEEPVQRAPDRLFADITDELDLDKADDAPDSDDAIQPSLF